EIRLRVAGPGTRTAMRPPAASQVAFGEHGQLERGVQESPLERLDDDLDPRIGEALPGPPTVQERGGFPVVAEQTRQAGAAASSLGTDDDAVTLGPELAQLAHETLAVTHNRV